MTQPQVLTVEERVKDGLAAAWDPEIADPETAQPGWVATLHVDDNWPPSDDSPQLLVANDGGPRLYGGPWAGRRAHRRPLLRLTAFARGRGKARSVVMTAADWVCDHKMDVGIIRVDDVSDPLITRDRATGAYLASITMPAIVRPS